MKRIQILRTTLASLFFALGLSAIAKADLLVIVNAENTEKLDPRFVKNLYLGKETRFSNGDTATPLIQSEKNKLTRVFMKEIIKQQPVQFKKHWSKALFTGKGTPPQEVANDAEMIRLVMSNPGMVGFIDSESYTNDVKAVLQVKVK